MGSKFHFSRCKTYLSKYINKSLKFEEIEYIIYYIKFIMQQALFYVKFAFYPNSSMDCKLRFFNVGIRKYLNFFRNLKRDWKSGYLNVVPDWIFKFPNCWKKWKLGIFKYSPVFCQLSALNTVSELKQGKSMQNFSGSPSLTHIIFQTKYTCPSKASPHLDSSQYTIMFTKSLVNAGYFLLHE